MTDGAKKYHLRLTGRISDTNSRGMEYFSFCMDP